MKIFCAMLLSLFFACNSTKNNTETQKISTETSMECPKGGECAFSVMKNKSMQLLEDGIGMKYPEFITNSGSNIIKFRFHRDSPEGMADGNYTEEIFMEIKDDVDNLSLNNESLQEVKLTFHRMCFCERGTVGYFPITEGNLEFRRNDDGTASIELNFKNNNGPQELERIAGNVSFK